MAVILKSENYCAAVEKKIRQELSNLGRITLASVALGNNYSIDLYRLSQARLARKFGIAYRLVNVPGRSSWQKFSDCIRALNDDRTVHGVIVNKPFSAGWRDDKVFSLLDEKKDVEGMHPLNAGKFFMTNTLRFSRDGLPSFDGPCVSPTVLSTITLIHACNVPLYGMRAVVIGFSSLIGRPLALWLAHEFATVSITHIATSQKGDLSHYVKNADIVISAAGKPHLISGAWIKKGAIVIDIGTGQKNGKLTGDVDFLPAAKRAAFITPVPGGVGKLTAAFLFHNLIAAARKQEPA